MKGDAVEEEGPFMLHRVAELCGGGMGEELWETGSKQGGLPRCYLRLRVTIQFIDWTSTHQPIV